MIGAREALDEKQLAWAKQKRRERYTFYEIADALFVDYKTVERAFIRHGIDTKRPRQILEYEA